MGATGTESSFSSRLNTMASSRSACSAGERFSALAGSTGDSSWPNPLPLGSIDSAWLCLSSPPSLIGTAGWDGGCIEGFC